MELEDRITRAVELFRSGYNCSQSVVAAFADLYGFTFEQALHMSASFGAAGPIFITVAMVLFAPGGRVQAAQRLPHLCRAAGPQEGRRLAPSIGAHAGVLRQATLPAHGGDGRPHLGGAPARRASGGRGVILRRQASNGSEKALSLQRFNQTYTISYYDSQD